MRSIAWKVVAALGLAVLLIGPAVADRGGVVRFATLPVPGPGFPEGLAADANGNIYVATFDFGVANVIYVFGSNGRLITRMPLPGVVPLGLAFDSAGNLWVADFANGNVLRFTPPFSAASVPVSYGICGGMGAGCGLNAMTFDGAGNLYVSDSFGGNIFRLAPTTGTVETFFTSDRLQAGAYGFPPFGANGLAFDAAGANLYIANTAHDRILRLALDAAGTPTTLSTFAESINGADGIVFDATGRLWVAANQADEVVALDGNGRVVDRVGSFEGLLPDGSPKGLLFPASIVISRGSLFVTNLALALTAAEGDEPEEDVTRYTVSRIPLPGPGR